MANVHDYFIRYRKNIDISPSKKDRLKSAEQAVRNQLEKYFLTQPDYNFHHLRKPLSSLQPVGDFQIFA